MKATLLPALFFLGILFVSYGQECGNPWINYKKQNDKLEKVATENSPTDGRISLRLAGNGSFVTILLGFIPEGTVNFDDGYDGPFINDGAVIEFYSFLGTTRLSIQALPELTNVNTQVPLGYELTSDDMYTISIDAEFLNPNFDIILEDTQENILTDLRQTSYTFSGVIGEAHSRFYLNLVYRNTLSINDDITSSKEVFEYFIENTINFVTKRTDIEKVVLYNLAGKRITSSNFKKKITFKNLPKGIYFIQYTTTSGSKIIKKIIK
ncbi:T9SS type A sorting domain-containing protein [Kordia algicida OT-1]|uniref:Secretion system C-terminal sorting domain-containing protein n=1 Tax=Kordia algicida OT-1 TaxID=391587 RepID=A9DMK8_9FLAO|nr:T9SS type A sorting domain-containing protein [Kordia algicida]EDP97730.1 hypothetical protein KAOT1_21247 [Kordia algicida OT-1]